MSRTLRHPRLFALATVLAASVALARCSPTPPSCVYSLSRSAVTLPAAGGSETVTVTTTNACSWTATSGAGWLTVAQPGSGSGGGTVSFSAGANGPAARSTTLTIASQSVAVTQEAAPAPRYTLSGRVTDVFFGPVAGLIGVTVTASGSAGSASAVTSYGGDYTIAGLLPGTYTVTFQKTYSSRPPQPSRYRAR